MLAAVRAALHGCVGAAAYATAVPRENSFIPRLLAAKYKEPGRDPKSLTDQQIVAQAYTLILAGQAANLGIKHTCARQEPRASCIASETSALLIARGLQSTET